MLELRVEKVFFSPPLCLQVLPVAFDIYIRSKTNVSRVEERQPAYSFLFLFFYFFSWKVWAPTNEVQSRRGGGLFG